MKFIHIHKEHPAYPASICKYLADDAPEAITAIGNADILQNKLLAVFSSVKCPGEIILKTYDLMRRLRDDGVTVISGFHSPIEQECLNILLRGNQPIIICPARSIVGMRIRKEFRQPMESGRLLILSPFEKKHNRVSARRSEIRNRFVAALANTILVPYAAPGGKSEALCREWIEKGKRVITFESNYNRNLFATGAEIVGKDNINYKMTVSKPETSAIAKKIDR